MENNATLQISDLPKQMVQTLFDSVEKGTIWAYRIIFDSIKKFIAINWKAFVIFLIVVLLIAVSDYLLTRKWRTLGRVLYSYIYWGTIFLIALLFGPEIFANDFVDILLFIIYIISFLFVGKLLKLFGIKI